MRRRKGHDEPRGNPDRWLLTYADLITLLMAFFVMMYSMSVLNLSKFSEAAISIRSGFGGNTPGQGRGAMGANGRFAVRPTPLPGDTAGVPWRVLKPLVNFVDKNARDSSMQVGEDDRGIVITMRSDKMLFKPGTSDIRPGAFPVLDRIADTLRRTENLVRIEGHTCDLSPRASQYASNWELSTARATNVLRYLSEKGQLPADRFAAAGYGSVRPIGPNTTEAGRGKNRRVEIVILRPGSQPEGRPYAEPRTLTDPDTPSIQRSTYQ